MKGKGLSKEFKFNRKYTAAVPSEAKGNIEKEGKLESTFFCKIPERTWEGHYIFYGKIVFSKTKNRFYSILRWNISCVSFWILKMMVIPEGNCVMLKNKISLAKIYSFWLMNFKCTSLLHRKSPGLSILHSTWTFPTE